MSSLLEEAEALESRRGGSCSVGLLAVSDPGLFAELVEALASSLTAAAISRALRARGVEIAGATIARHRAGGCKCR